jgi:hypothetical protein
MTENDRPILICPHLAAAPGGYHVWFTGRGIDCHWVCPTCAASYPDRPVELVQVTEASFERCQTKASCSGICGSPEVKRRPSSLSFMHEEFSLSSFSNERWIDAQPNLRSDAEWYLVSASGDFSVTNPRRGEFKILYRLTDLGFEIDDETALCVSSGNDYGAIYQVSNSHACVFNLRTGAVTARISRGDYGIENSSFPIAFFESAGRPLMVAATDWNRLDIIDPATGALLTDRGPTSYRRGEQQPPHYLDYFHAGISVSPDATSVVDNGWFWHPLGIVRSWNLRDWLERNPWESEDGPSLKTLAARAYYWDGPTCWIDDSTIAIWGWGDDDEQLIPAVRLFDVRTGRETHWFPGPDCRRPGAWPPKKLVPSLFFDRYLFSVHDEQGTAVWDISSGERLLQDSSLIPKCYHLRSREFLSLSPNGIRLSRLTG